MVLMRKLPPSLTAWAWRGSLPTTEMPRESGSSNGPGCGDGVVCAGHHDPKLAGLGDIGPAEDRRGNEADAAAGVLCGQLFAESDADGAAGDVKRAGFERVHQAVGAEEDFFVRRIVEEHGDDGVGAKLGFCRSARGDGAFAEQRFGAPLGAVPHRSARGRRRAGAAPWACPSCRFPRNPIFMFSLPASSCH